MPAQCGTIQTPNRRLKRDHLKVLPWPSYGWTSKWQRRQNDLKKSRNPQTKFEGLQAGNRNPCNYLKKSVTFNFLAFRNQSPTDGERNFDQKVQLNMNGVKLTFISFV